MRYRNLFLVAVAAMFCAGLPLHESFAGGSVRQVAKYHGMQLRGVLQDGTEFEASVDTVPFNEELAKGISRFWGQDAEHPSRLIGQLSVTVQGKAVHIPRAAMSDLGDVLLPAGFYLLQEGKDIILVLEGGDGAGAYQAELEIRGAKAISRTIHFINSQGEEDTVSTRYE